MNENQIIFSSQYLYGSGIMYVKMVQDSDINTENFYKVFPDKEYDRLKSDFSYSLI